MITKQIVYYWIGSILVCALINAIILGLFSEAYLIADQPNEKYTFLTYTKGILTAFLVILILGYWLFYILGLVVFQMLVKRLKSKHSINYIMLGAFVGVLCTLPFLVFQGTPEGKPWYTSSSFVRFNLLTYMVVGAVYGLVYRKWLTSYNS